MLGLSLGQSAVYAVIRPGGQADPGPAVVGRRRRSTRRPRRGPTSTSPTSSQASRSRSCRSRWCCGCSPVTGPARRSPAGWGWTCARPLADLGSGALLAAVIGMPGIALYLVGHALGITATVVPEALNAYWWTLPVLSCRP